VTAVDGTPQAAAPASTLLEHIAERRSSMRRSEAKVADVILRDPVGAIEFNMAGLADAADVSEPTVMRFCGAIGLDGFRSFKIALAQTVAIGLPITHSAIERSDGAKELTEKIFDHTISSLDRARRRLDVAVIERAIDLLAAASDLLFVGFGASGIIAQDAQQKFPLFGVPCQAPADYHQQYIAASMSRPSSVTVAISHTGATRETIRVAEATKAAGGTVISITGEDGALSGISDLDIRISTFEDTDFTTPSVSRLAGLVVIDILATGVTLRRSEQDLQQIAVMKERLAGMRSETP
jgi:RpiR family carbohydrate utilization transcriptional regulator